MTEPSIATHASHARQPATHPNAGRMTAVMRAVSAPAAPRVLRIGLLREGRIVEERILKRPETVTLGSDERATFLVTDPAALRLVPVLERDRGAYYLNAPAPITGRVALVDGIHDVASLRARGRVRLDDGARGRVVLGSTTLLFQFVDAPPASPRPRLPLAVKEGVGLDAGLTIIAAFSFLLHFGLVGALYSDWSDPVVDEGFSIGALVDLGPTIRPPSPEPPPSDAAKDTPKDTADAKKDETARPTPVAKDRGAPAPGHDAQRRAREDAMARDAQAMGMGILVSFGGTTAVDAALRRGEIPPVDMTEAAKSAAAVTRPGDGLNLATSGFVGPVSKRGLDGIAGVAGVGVDGHPGEVAVKPPPTTIQLDPVHGTTPIPGAERTVAQLRPRFRACYNRGLADDPSMSGSVVIRAKIAPNGEVTSADPSSISGISTKVAACLTKVVQNAQFDPPGSLGSTLDIPVKVVQQR